MPKKGCLQEVFDWMPLERYGGIKRISEIPNSNIAVEIFN
ncbi:hypothetical protein CsSME_00044409 [Camellia sinensis var. sinensis]